MRKALLISALLCSILSFAQGPQQLVSVPVDWWPGANVPGWLYLPADYHTSNKKYPVVFFYHGVGEAGTNPYQLLGQGLPNMIAQGVRPDNITNPIDGQQYSFIVLSVQHWSWSPLPSWLPYELAWLKQNYRIDTNRVYVTGLSAGGQTSFGAAVNDPNISKLIAAAVPMSPAALGAYNPSLINQFKIKTWFFAGNNDGGYTANAVNYSQMCNNVLPSSSRLSMYSGGHCCWNTYYNPSWHDPVTGYSVWEWMLTNTKETFQTLPVNFESFEAVRSGAGARLTWKVVDEIDVDRYEVEKSADGVVFSTTGQVPAAFQPEYSFTDARLNGKTFYRIKSVDQNGTNRYSAVVSVDGDKSSVVIRAFPVPANKTVTLNHPTAAKGSRIDVSSMDGRILTSIPPSAGTQQSVVDISRLASGTYFISFAGEDGRNETTRIVKN